MPVIGSHLLSKLSETNWYIIPQNLKIYEAILDSKFVEGKHFDQLMKMSTMPMDGMPDPMPILKKKGSKATIDISGTMMKKASYMDAMCGMTGMDAVSQALDNVAADNSIDHLILCWDSPGGTVDGTEQLTEQIYAMRSSLHVTSFISGLMASAAYYAGSAADDIYASSKLDLVGSIGVVATHVDQSIMDMQKGLKYTYIYAGAHKIDGNPHESLNAASLKSIQDRVNYDYESFLSAIGKNRNLSREQTLAIADGQIFKAGNAVATGMIDGITSLNALLRS